MHTLLSNVVRQAELAACQYAQRVECYTEGDGSHVILVVFRNGARKEMHAPPGELEIDWEATPENLRWQKRLGEG